MKIYPITEAFERILEDYTDPETGELKRYVEGPFGPAYVSPEKAEEAEANGIVLDYLDTEQLLLKELQEQQTDFAEFVRNLRNDHINRKAEAEALKAEKLKLQKRQQTAEKAADRAARFLAYLLQGEKYQDGDIRISYRRSEQVVCDDEFIEWASANAPGLLKVEPEIRRADVKAALKNGTLHTEHAHLEERQNIQIK